jgi:hypothetical protein
LKARPSLKRRPDRLGERILYGALCVIALFAIAPYVVGFVYLLVAGAARAGSFAMYPAPPRA